ncbi:MAG: phosphate acyltransferase PlsX [Gammaproteobacteria bacterium]
MSNITISIDAMGGDFGPEVTIPAALRVLATHPDLKLIVVGDQPVLQQVYASHSALHTDRLVFQHASEQVGMDESPSQALRLKKDSSMRVALNLVKSGLAQACVSAGNTGALMVTARFVLKTLPGIDRPAIITSFPTIKPDKEVWIVDLGANVDSQAEHLFQFAVMGSVLVSLVRNIERPTIALLNIGEEEIKGNEQVKQTAQLLAESPAINYYGYIEGNDLFSGLADVVVCDGFVGNVTLKAVEGVAKLMSNFAKTEFKRNLYTQFVALLALPILNRLKKRADPGRRNGACLIGLQGIVIKSHGSADVAAFANAIEQALVQAQSDIPRKISQEVAMRLNQ